MFNEQFGKILRHSIHTDSKNKKKLAGHLRFKISATKDNMWSNTDYVSRTKKSQTDNFWRVRKVIVQESKIKTDFEKKKIQDQEVEIVWVAFQQSMRKLERSHE
jgi:HSP90 family molecular chaperone